MLSIRTACFLDFDHTLFNTDEFFHVDVRNAFLRFGIDDALWEQSYERAWQTGYTLEKHTEEVYRQSGNPLPLEDMKRIIRDMFSDLRRYLFPDTLRFLGDTKNKGVRLFLLSFGNPDWQRYKVFGSQVDGYFNDMFFIPREGGKAKFISELMGGFDRILMVDNNPAELDVIKNVTPTVETYCINRVPDEMLIFDSALSRLKFLEARRYVGKIWRHQHIACRNLDGIISS